MTVSNDVSANTGFWGGAARKTLADWQTATNQDANSISGQSNFVDIDGADNILGYVTTTAGRVHGGTDDNFYVTRNSPVIDRGSTWSGTSVDIEGFGRTDDPGTVNTGASRYIQTTQSIPSFPTTGVAQNWRNDNASWQFNLPYSFPFYGTNYSTIWVSSNGFIDLGPFDFNAFGDPNNTQAKLLQFTRIAPLWDDLTTANPGDDIFVDSSVVGQTTFRWNATNKANNADVHFSVTIGSDGRIEFLYGAGVSSLTPTAGISRGNKRDFELATGIDGATAITGLQANRFPIVAGITDIGAYEFRGSSLDTQSPTLVGSSPAAIHASGVTAQSLDSLQLNFSEEVNPIDARSPAAYELRSAGVNNTFGDSDDVVYPLRPQYTPGQNSVQLVIGALDGGPGTSNLPIGRYQVTVLGSSGTSIYDLAGNQFDGNADSNAGGNYTRVFRVIDNAAPQLFGANPLPTIFSSISNANNTGLRVADLISNQIVDPDGPAQGVAITSVGVAGGTWEYSLNGVAFQSVASSLLGGRTLLLAADSDTRIRFVPQATSSGLINTLTLRAWDQADEFPEGTALFVQELSANSLSSNSVNAAVNVVAPSIPNQQIYYRGSSFSQGGNNVPAALDPNKVFARSGNTTQTLTYANLINTTRGINGVVLDMSGLAASSLANSDFVFRMSPTGLFNEAANPPSTWANAPSPTGIFVTAGTQNTPARVRIEWNDNDIANRWLQIQVIANSNTGLPSTNVFYIGHLQGEVNGSATGGALFVTTLDQSAVLPLGIATVGNNRDIDKNAFVTSNDLTAVRVSINAGRALRVITIPVSGSSNEGTVTGGFSLLRGSEDSPVSKSNKDALIRTAVPLLEVAPLQKDESKVRLLSPEILTPAFAEDKTGTRFSVPREISVTRQQTSLSVAKSNHADPSSLLADLKTLDEVFSALVEEW